MACHAASSCWAKQICPDLNIKQRGWAWNRFIMIEPVSQDRMAGESHRRDIFLPSSPCPGSVPQHRPDRARFPHFPGLFLHHLPGPLMLSHIPGHGQQWSRHRLPESSQLFRLSPSRASRPKTVLPVPDAGPGSVGSTEPDGGIKAPGNLTSPAGTCSLIAVPVMAVLCSVSDGAQQPVLPPGDPGVFWLSRPCCLWPGGLLSTCLRRSGWQVVSFQDGGPRSICCSLGGDPWPVKTTASGSGFWKRKRRNKTDAGRGLRPGQFPDLGKGAKT